MRLIDADHLKESWYNFDHRRKLTECFDEEPTVDAAIIKHGKWINTSEPDEDKNVETECSVCHAGDKHAINMAVPYCWKCGSKMDSTI